MASDNGKKYILSNIEDFAKKNSFNDTFKMAKTWEEIGFHVSALSYNGFRVITLSRWGSGVFQLFFSGDTFFKTRYSLGAIHYSGITQWTKDYIDDPYGIQRAWFNFKNGYQESDKYHYKEFLKNKNKVNTNENMKKQTIKLNESQLREVIREALNEYRGEYSYDDQDGDIHYVRPNGKPYVSGENWKTMYNASSVGNERGKRAYERDRYASTPNMFNYGKGKLCFQLLKTLSETFQIEMSGLEAEPSGKINWTPEELKRISDIYMQILSLAKLSKEEGTRTRGQQPKTI